MCGPATIQIEGFDTIVGEVVFLDVDAADEGYEPLLGYIVPRGHGDLFAHVGGHQVRHLDLK